MSAIWGAVSLENKKLPENIPAVFRRYFSECVLDRVEEIADESIYLGCGIQYFTKEARYERLPVSEAAYCFNADVVLDNREDIINKLGIQISNPEEIPDGELLFKMYQKHGQGCLNDLLGAYAFVYYDREQQQADIVIDAVGDRMVYYAMHEGILYFSSLLMPLAELTKAKLNDRWMTDFLAMDHLFMINETEETPFEDVYRVAPAYSVSITSSGITKRKYWNPMDTVRPLKLKNDAEYKEAFQKVFMEAVRCKMRDGQISALLSGGYDSTAVTAVASHILKEKGEKIISFTSVPLADYEAKADDFYVENEKEIVEETVRFLGNIEPYYVQMEGVNPWSGHEEGMKRIEMPYKSSLNFLWIPECMKQAGEMGSRIMLGGSYGNTTISFENIEVYFEELKKRMRFIRLNREIKAFAANYGFDPAYAKKKIFIPKKKLSRVDTRWRTLYRNSYVRPSIVAETGCDARILKLNRMFAESSMSHEKQRSMMMHELSLRQIGEVSQKNSLATGVLLRDPTKDKRVIEFCMSIPYDQFNKCGEGRRLVSQYLKEYMPSHIFAKKYQGRQSADFSYRIALDWENIRNQWMQQCRECADSRYVDAGYEYVQLKKSDKVSDYTQMDLTRHVYTQMVMEYERKYAKLASNTCVETIAEKEPLISVIVPVYNNGDALKKCVESILAQTYKNLEIVLVDDGSADGSGDICDRYAEMDKRVKVIHQENGGVSKARNAALEIVTGDYVGFVDADDYIFTDMYETLLKNLRKYKVQLAGCGVECIDYEGRNITACQGFTFVYNGAEMLETFLGYSRRTTVVAISVWNKLFDCRLVKDRRFMEVNKYEDQEFTWSALCDVDGAVFVDIPLYHYEMKKEGLHNRKYGGTELREFLALEERVITHLKACERIREEGYLNHVTFYYTRLMEWLCGQNGKLAWSDWWSGRKALNRIRRDMFVVIRNEKQMGTGERWIRYSSLYSIGIYKGLRRCQAFIRKKRKAFK